MVGWQQLVHVTCKCTTWPIYTDSFRDIFKHSLTSGEKRKWAVERNQESRNSGEGNVLACVVVRCMNAVVPCDWQ